MTDDSQVFVVAQCGHPSCRAEAVFAGASAGEVVDDALSEGWVIASPNLGPEHREEWCPDHLVVCDSCGRRDCGCATVAAPAAGAHGA